MRGPLFKLFHPVDPEVLYALRYKMPSSVNVEIEKDPDGGYIARVHDLGGQVVTQGQDGLELFEMVNDAILTALQIPEQYKVFLANFLPPEEVRESLQIPDKYLSKEVELVKAG